MVTPTPPLERFWRSVDRSGTCWVWTGQKGGKGRRYGYFRPGTRSTDPRKVVHKWLYEILIGQVPEGHELDHRCRNTLCVRLDHLEPVTGDENKARTRLVTCKSGLHQLTPETTIWDERGRRRGCRLCPNGEALQRHFDRKR